MRVLAVFMPASRSKTDPAGLFAGPELGQVGPMPGSVNVTLGSELYTFKIVRYPSGDKARFVFTPANEITPHSNANKSVRTHLANAINSSKEARSET